MPDTYVPTAEDRAAEAAYKREQKADEMTELLSPVISNINGMSSSAGDALATAVSREHPTLAGQLARGVAMGVMRRVVRDPDWKPWDKTSDLPRCQTGQRQTEHPDHDGRFSCDLVIGAELMARQGFI